MMKRPKKRYISFFIILFAILSFRGPLFRWVVKYQPLNTERATFNIHDTGFKNWIDQHTNFEELNDLEAIIDHALALTAKKLSFTFNPAQRDPNRLFQTEEANCVGYSAFFSTACNYIIQKQGLEKHIKVGHLVGTIEFLGFDLNQLSDDPFFSDHDFNLVEDQRNQQKYYIDPSVYDYLYIKRVQLRNQ